MEKDFGYNELLLLAKRLESRASYFAAEADDSQSDGMKPYLESQRASLEKAESVLGECEDRFLRSAKERIAEVDKETTVRLLHAYGKYGVKES